ncbi:hypothetical protein OAE88_00565 [bacterium]|nr:hypothetical protein [bacterium]
MLVITFIYNLKRHGELSMAKYEVEDTKEFWARINERRLYDEKKANKRRAETKRLDVKGD